MNYIFFIESISAKEWLVGEIIHGSLLNEIMEKDFCSCLKYIDSLEQLKNIVSEIVKLDEDASIIIQIDAHSDDIHFTFKNYNSQNKEEYTEYYVWDNIYESFEPLFTKFKSRILLVFASCCSSSYFTSLCSPHIKVISAEGIVYPHRAEEQLFVFYRDYLQSQNFEHAYDAMCEKFPLENERKREKDKAILIYSN